MATQVEKPGKDQQDFDVNGSEDHGLLSQFTLSMMIGYGLRARQHRLDRPVSSPIFR